MLNFCNLMGVEVRVGDAFQTRLRNQFVFQRFTFKSSPSKETELRYFVFWSAILQAAVYSNMSSGSAKAGPILIS